MSAVHPKAGLEEQIGEFSSGRLRFNPRRRLLVHRSEAGGKRELEITEVQLRGLLQRLLLSAPHPPDGESLEVAVCLLLEHLDARS
ncbi:hypothetical protein GCM10027062_04580 [Nocardioides hungaricus]